MNKMSVSVCMIAGAEAHRIRHSLESVADWVGEIVLVVNEEVTDGTDRIAEEYGARVYRERWKGYVDQKNSAAEKAQNDWLLGLDADEVVPPPLGEEIRQRLADPRQCAPFAAFSLPRCTRYCGRWIRHGDWYPDRKVRLWRRGRARWEGTTLHEKLKVEGRVGRLRADLLHYSIDSLNQQLRKTESYADLFAQHWQKAGRKAGIFDLLVRPGWRFARGYGLRLGFLDGWQGLAIAWVSTFYTFLRYARTRENSSRELAPQ